MAAFLMATGQIMLKLAAVDIKTRKSYLSVWGFGAVAAYGLTTGIWVWVLTMVPLSSAYPFAMAGAAMVPLMAALLFKERLSRRFFLGFAIILLGLVITQTS